MSVVCKRGVNGSTVTTSSIEPVLAGFCRDEWYISGNYCYKLFGLKPTDKRPWKCAQKKCQTIGAQLVSIHSQAEQDFLSDLVVNIGYATWTGMYATKGGKLYHWVDNTSIDYTYWDEDKPLRNGMPENCVEMIHHEENVGKWNDAVCNKPKAFICKQRKDPTLKGPGLDPSKCTFPQGWSKLGSSCFSQVSKKTLPWLEAQSWCKEFGTNLLTIGDYGVTLFLKRLLSSKTQSFVWIGAKEHGLETNRYAWISTHPISYSNWLKGQPKRVSNHNNCVATNAQGKWVVKDCREKLPFLCEHNSEIIRPRQNLPRFVCPRSSMEWIYLRVGPNCYHIVTQKLSYFGAMYYCVYRGSSLASFHSLEELNAIAPYLKPARLGLDWPVHKGAARTNDDGLYWIDRSAVDYVLWEKGETNSGDERCVAMDTKILAWDNTKCSEKRYFICSIRKVPLIEMVINKKNPMTSDDRRTSVEKNRFRWTAGLIVVLVICAVITRYCIIYALNYLCSYIICRHREERLTDEDGL